MNSLKTILAVGAILVSVGVPASAYTFDEVNTSMENRIISLNNEISGLQAQPGSDRGKQNAEIRKLRARVKQIEAQQRNLAKKSEAQLDKLVDRFDLVIVSPA